MTQLFRLIILTLLPLIALDIARQLYRGAYIVAAIDLLIAAVAVFLAVRHTITYRWRVAVILCASLLSNVYLLLSGGLESAGPIYIIFHVAITALILNRRATLLVWLSGAAALLFGVLAFADRARPRWP
ncbi:MAG: hypothetical protein HC828_01420 [Blastochloris sp.]|nr:hypothetical protein [Blastochloris sp.]